MALNNQIVINGTVGSVTVVGFADVSGSNADNTFVNAGAALDLGFGIQGGTFTPLTTPLFVRHNNTGEAVQMALVDVANSGNLTDGVDVVPMTYTALGVPVVVGGGATTILSGTADAGSTSLGDFVATSGTIPALATAGTYTTTLTVTISSL
ncbi:MAG: hypothetical protein OEW60_07100 [Thiovulaceae bacterium]|nr:hypothetical protein [Sulfurimonadaceae bacterium]